MEKTCLKCKSVLSFVGKKYVCNACDTKFILMNGELIEDISTKEDVMTESVATSNIGVILEICENNLNQNYKNVKQFYKDLLDAMNKYPIDEKDLSRVVDLIVSKVDIDFLPTHGAAYKSILKSYDKKRRIEQLKQKFSIELEKALADLLTEFNKVDRKKYYEKQYVKANIIYKKRKAEMLELTYLTENYTQELKKIINEFKKSVKKVKTIAQIKKIKKTLAISSIVAGTLAVSGITIGFIPKLEYRLKGNNQYEVIGVDGLFFDAHFKMNKVKIPEKYQGKLVTSIAPHAFENELIREVKIPESIKTIGDYAFANNELVNVEIPDSVTSIGAGAFKKNEKLEKVIIKGNVDTLKNNLFNGCGKLVELSMENTPYYINDGAFCDCSSLKTIPDFSSLKNIGSSAFANCTSLESISLSDSLSSVAQNAFNNTPNLSIDFDGSGFEWSQITGIKGNIVFSEYTVQYRPTQGSNVSKSRTLTMKTSATLEYNEANGYEFKGYYTNSNGAGVQATDATGKTLSSFTNNTELLNKASAIQLYPYFEAITYNISFESNGGSKVSDTSYTIEDNVYLETPTRKGFTFDGWYNNPFFTGDKVSGGEGMFGNMTLYARWNKNTYYVLCADEINVTFDYCYDDITEIVEVKSSEVLEYPEEPTRDGYVFAGWYKDSGYTTKYYYDETIAEDMTLYAKWDTTLPSYEKASEVNSYSTNYKIVSNSSSGALSYADRIVIDETGTYDFYYSNSYSDDYYQIYLTVYNETRGTTIYSGSYISNTSYNSVSFDAIVGDVIRIETYYYYYTSYFYYYFETISEGYTSSAKALFEKTGVSYSENFEIAVVNKTGYEFKGYFSEKDGQGTQITDGSGNSVDVYNYDYDLTVYPYYEKINYAINYHNVEDATNPNTNTTYTIVDEIELKEPTRDGYTFAGWYIDSSYTESITSISGLHEDLDLYAKWSAKSYTIFVGESLNVTFDYCYDDITEIVEVKSSEALEYPEEPTRDGYVFAGWYKDSGYTTKYYFTGTIAEDMTLYAKWETSLTSSYEKASEVNSYSTNYKYVSNSSSYANSYADRIVIDETGTYDFYYSNSYSDDYYRIYLTVYNETRGTTIRSGSYISNTSYNSVSFDAIVGDVIRIETYYYYNYSSLYYYFEIISEGYESDATIDCDTTNVIFDESFKLSYSVTTGATFKGYYTEENGQGTQVTDELGQSVGKYTYTTDLAVYPYYEYTNYSITYHDVEDATNPNTNTTYTIVDEIELKEPTRDGYTFAGWYIDSSYTESITSISGLHEDLDLYAKWSANSYVVTIGDPIVVTFDYQCEEIENKEVILFGSEVLEYPEDPTREGYIFTGWYTDSYYTTKYYFTGTIAEDMTLYAKWDTTLPSYEKVSEVNVDNTNYKYVGNSSSDAISNADRIVIDKTGTYNFYYKNYYYSSYYYEIYLTIYNETCKETISSITVLYTDYNSISFDAVAGDVIRIETYYYYYTSYFYYYFESVSEKYESDATSSLDGVTVKYGELFTLDIDPITGYTFKGYFTEKDGQGTQVTDELGQSVEKYTYTTDLVVYPYYEYTNYSITYHDVEDATNPNTNTTYTIVDEIELKEPTRDGYTFAGWYIDSSYTESITSISGLHEDLDLYAKWSANSYTISVGEQICVTFDYQCEDIENKKVSVISSSCLEYPDDPTREGYIFTGWYTDSDYTTKYYFTGTIAEDMTLYAKWDTTLPSYEKVSEVNVDNTNDKIVSNSSGGALSNADRIVIDKTGTYSFYYKNFYSSYNYRIYLTVYNETRGTTIRSGSYISNTSYSSVTFDAIAGDVIRIETYYYYYTSTFYYYFESVSNKFYSSAYSTVAGAAVVYDSEFDISTSSSYDGTMFLGYYTEVDGRGTQITDRHGHSLEAYNFTSNLIVYPYFDYAYSISYYNVNENENNNPDYIKAYSELELTEPTRDGYTFEGWYTNSSFTSDPITTLSDVTSSVYLYAKWTINTYTLTLVNMHSSETYEIEYNQSFTVNPLEDIMGYQFEGYYTEEGGQGTKVIDSSYSSLGVYNYTEDITLYAYYLDVYYIVSSSTTFTYSSYDKTYTSSNGGTSSSSSSLVLEIQRDGTLSFDYMVSSESGWDKLIVTINGATKTTYSGEYTGTLTYEVDPGDEVTIEYSKDDMYNSGSDKVVISNIGFQAI